MPPDHSNDSCVMARRLAERLGARLVETHISWVLLGEREAYKLKKPLRMPFLDYGTPEARRHCCAEEVRINARLAPGLYLGVVSVHGSPQDPRIGGDGPVIDWAVRMRRFDDDALFGERLARQQLAPEEVDTMADLLAGFHEEAAVADPALGLGTGKRRRATALAALQGASAALQPVDQNALQAWLQRESQRLNPCWAARLKAGRIRECHGDLHLDNLIWLNGGPAAFDGIEFDPALRWIDVADDIAFPVMDLAARGRSDLDWRLLNRWLDNTGDHGALGVLRLAAVYRALVRAQVALLRADSAAATGYARAAGEWMQSDAPRLTVMHGLPGSGKTHVSQRLLEQHGAIRLRADVERKRLFGIGMLDNSRDAGVDIYTAGAGRRTYARLLSRAAFTLRAGYPVILDAAHLHRHQRDAAHALAKRLGAGFTIASCEAPMDVLRQRVRERRGDASEADLAVLEMLAGAGQPLGKAEQPFVERYPAA